MCGSRNEGSGLYVKDSYGGHISFIIIRTCILLLNAKFFPWESKYSNHHHKMGRTKNYQFDLNYIYINLENVTVKLWLTSTYFTCRLKCYGLFFWE